MNINIRTFFDPRGILSVYNQPGDVYLFYLRHKNRFNKHCTNSYVGIDKSLCSADTTNPVNAPVIMTS